MTPIPLGDVLRSALALFRGTSPVLARRVLPLLAIICAIDMAGESEQSRSFIAFAVASWLVAALANAWCLIEMLKARVSPNGLPLSKARFAMFLLLRLYLSAAVILAAFLFVFPALVVLAVTILAPIFLLREGLGPFDAVGSSINYTAGTGNVVQISVIFLACFIPFVVASSIVEKFGGLGGILALPIAYAAAVALAFVGLYYNAVMVILYERLRPNPAVHTDLAREAAQGR